ncbi:MAG: AMP-binding protein, partial [Algicola sp.]|nr:AMP-binding protein [Algicola sp.]
RAMVSNPIELNLELDSTADSQSFALHPAQENIYFEQILHPESSIYHTGLYTVCDKHYDLVLLQQAWGLLYRHIDALRLVFSEADDGLLVQAVKGSDSQCGSVDTRDFSHHESPLDSAMQWMQQQVDGPMDYLGGETAELTLVNVDPDNLFLFTRVHHLIIDGVAIYLLHRHLHEVYRCLETDSPTTWLADIQQYAPMVQSARDYLDSKKYTRSKNHWTEFFQNRDILRLTPYYQSNENKTMSGETTRQMSEALSDGFFQFCQTHKLSPLVLITAFCGLYFAKTTETEDTAMVTTVHARQGKGAMGVLGMFINVLPIAFKVELGTTFETLLGKVKSRVNNSMRHWQFPSSHLARLLPGEQNLLPDVQVVYDALDKGTGNRHESRYVTSSQDLLPLSIRLLDSEADSTLKLRITYNRCYFSAAEAELLVERLLGLIAQGLNNPQLPVDQFSMMPAAERDSIITGWQQPDVAHPQETINRLFERQAQKTPDNIALVFEHQQLSYAQLNQRANQLAENIRASYGVKHQQPLGAGTFIGLYTERCSALVIGILAIFKAGGVYVPMSTEAPDARCQFMLNDTAAAVVVTQQSCLPTLESWRAELDTPPLLISIDVPKT